MRARSGKRRVVRDRRAVDGERTAWQRLERGTERRIAHKVVRPGGAAEEDQRLAIISVGLSKRPPSSVRTSVAFVTQSRSDPILAEAFVFGPGES